MGKKQKEFFGVVFVSREDLKVALENADRQDLAAKVDKLTDADMNYIAAKMGDAIIENAYWDICEVVAEESIERLIKKEKSDL
jgi:hypothetical protein